MWGWKRFSLSSLLLSLLEELLLLSGSEYHIVWNQRLAQVRRDHKVPPPCPGLSVLPPPRSGCPEYHSDWPWAPPGWGTHNIFKQPKVRVWMDIWSETMCLPQSALSEAYCSLICLNLKRNLLRTTLAQEGGITVGHLCFLSKAENILPSTALGSLWQVLLLCCWAMVGMGCQ